MGPLAVLVFIVLVGSGITWFLVGRGNPFVVAECTGTVGARSFSIDPDQAANATTIAAEASRLGLPAHAVSVGLAAALQESKLRNLDYGDRDSLGLFQQRPSQGWGTPAQLQQPRYAAAAFFRGLVKVPGWEVLPIYQAAQRVQRSADASAYAAWDTEARVLAQGITGQVPGGYSCRYPDLPRPSATARSTLDADVRAALGPSALTPSVSAAQGWLVASWLISRAPTYSLQRVSVNGWTWRNTDTGWQRDPNAPARGVTFVTSRPTG